MSLHRLNLCTCLLLLLWIAGPLIASETRTTSMGRIGLFTKDNSNISLFPGSLTRYGNQIISELRVKNDISTFSAGVHLPLGDNGIGAVYLNRPVSLPVPAGLLRSVDMDGVNDLIIGSRFGENSLGIRATFGYNKSTVDTSAQKLEETAQFFEFAGGVSSETYDFGAFFNLPRVENKFPGANGKWSGTGFGVSGRFFLGPEETIQYVPAVVISQLSADLETDSIDVSTDFLSFRMALGARYQVDPRNLVVVAVEFFGFEQNKTDTPGSGKETVKTSNLPAFYLGGETQPLKWLIIRLGATHANREVKRTFRPAGGRRQETKVRDSKFDVFFGAGLQVGRFLLDMDINRDFLFEGPDFLSGQGIRTARDLFNKVSLTYQF